MPTTRYGLSNRSFARAVGAVAVLGAAYGVMPAGVAAAREVPAQSTAPSSTFDVFLVLPANSGLFTSSTSSNGTQTTEQLSAFSLSTSAPNSTGLGSTGLGAGKTSSTASQAAATMPLDTTSTNLQRDVLESRTLNPVQVEFRRGGGAGKETTYLTYSFRNATITSYQLQDSAGAASVQVTFAFQGITLSFGTGATSTGTVVPPSGWSVTSNRAV
jgi:type VI protein secretion system component Hcp